MKVKYSTEKKARINYRFMGFTPNEIGWWYNYNTSKWEQNPKAGKLGYSSHQSCNSMKAFRRKLKKVPYGLEFILVSRWVGYDIIGKGSLK